MKTRGHALFHLSTLWLICLGLVAIARAEPAAPHAPPTLAGCPVLPAENIWNVPVDNLPLDPNSAAYVNTIGASAHVHADFGSGEWEGGPIGIPYLDVPGSQPKVNVTFDYDDESDHALYPIPANAPIEGGPNSDGDRHVLVLDRDACVLYELFYAFPQAGGNWHAGSGAIFNLRSNALRQETWTSADAAGLPILPGLVRYAEVAAGEINHAIRFTAPETRRAYVWPARHYASSRTGSQYPPMGQRFRLKANYDISGFHPQVQVILRAMKKYGIVLADNGSAWYISGAPHAQWDNDILHQLHNVPGSAFEAVNVSSLMVDPNSGQVIKSFTLNTLPAGQAIQPGSSARYYVTLTALGIFTDVVTLTAASPSPSLTLALTSLALTPPGLITLTVTDTHPAGPLLPGVFYSIPITATGGSVLRTTAVGLLVGGARVYLPVILKNR